MDPRLNRFGSAVLVIGSALFGWLIAGLGHRPVELDRAVGLIVLAGLLGALAAALAFYPPQPKD